MSNQADHPLIDTEQLQQWLTDLPWLNAEQTAAYILEQLQQLTRTPLPPRQRSQLLKVYQPHLAQLAGIMESGLLDAPLPLSSRQREHAQLLLGLCEYMGENYARIVLGQDFSNPRHCAPKERPLQCTHLLEWLGRMALYRAQVYDPVGKNFWNTFYLVYQRIEEHRMLPPPEEGQPEDIRSHLLRILLFGLCGPQCFRQGELHQIDRFLRLFAHHAEIRSHPICGKRRAAFFFDSTMPFPPQSIKLLKRNEAFPQALRFLYPREVTQRLLEYVTTSQPQGIEVLPSMQARKLALRLAHILGVPRQRKWQRLQGRGECRLIVGRKDLIATLEQQGRIHKDLHSLLSVPIQENTHILTDIDFDLIPLETETFSTHHAPRSELDSFRKLMESRTRIHHRDIWEETPATEEVQEKEEPIHFAGHISDSSTQGYNLLWLDHSTAKLKIGEILSILHSDEEIEIGVIRWLKRNSDQSINVGVELLSFAAEVVVVGMRIPPGNDAKPKRDWGLLLPVQPTIQRPTCLLASAFTWQKGHWVDIYRNRKTKESYSLKKLLDSTPAYDLFALETLN